MVSPALRSAVLRLAISVIVLDAIAITIYYAADIPLRPPSIRYPFFGAWIALTLAVVLEGLHRIRMARGRRP
jgi:divalent metal cation (Fe/Co/Zn/Cd) transporter